MNYFYYQLNNLSIKILLFNYFQLFLLYDYFYNYSMKILIQCYKLKISQIKF